MKKFEETPNWTLFTCIQAVVVVVVVVIVVVVIAVVDTVVTFHVISLAKNETW